MGYAYYEISLPNGKKMKRGYGVSCKCHKRGCKEKIGRGLAYLCYNCTWYFCEKHKTTAYCVHDEPIEVECFAGEGSQVCQKCEKVLEEWSRENQEDCVHE